MFCLLIVVEAESTYRSDKERAFTFYESLAICVGMIVLLMYVARTINGMW